MAPDIVTDENGRETETIRPRTGYRSPPRDLKKESERLKTFKNWTVSFLDSKKLAKLGFYYTNTGDVVKCAFCDVQIGCWGEGDIPEHDHRRLMPDCPMVTGQVCANLVQSDSGEETEEDKEQETTPSQDVCGSYGLEIRPFSGPERPGKVPFSIESNNLWRDFEQLGVSRISGPVSPYYVTYSSRLKTFENWPIPEIQPPEKLAEAGFHYTSFQDNVLCFHCGGGLKNWEPEDDPWVEHAHWFSKCGFVILRKGREFVIEVLKKAKMAAEREAAGNSEAKPRVDPAEEKKKEKKEEKEEEQTASTPSSETSSLTSTSTSDELSESPSSNGKEIELCRICYVRERGIVFLPCGHFVSCTECAPSLSTCAVCRKPFEATVRAYLS